MFSSNQFLSFCRTVDRLWSITEDLNILYKENWTRLAAQEVQHFQVSMARRWSAMLHKSFAIGIIWGLRRGARQGNRFDICTYAVSGGRQPKKVPTADVSHFDWFRIIFIIRCAAVVFCRAAVSVASQKERIHGNCWENGEKSAERTEGNLTKIKFQVRRWLRMPATSSVSICIEESWSGVLLVFFLLFLGRILFDCDFRSVEQVEKGWCRCRRRWRRWWHRQMTRKKNFLQATNSS